MWRNAVGILIFFVNINYIVSLIVFPFKISESQDKSFQIKNDLHSETYLGDSKQLTDLFFFSDDHLYFIDDDKERCKGQNFFIKNFSEYNKSHYTIDIDENQKAYQIEETIYLYQDLHMSNIKKIENFPFLMKTTTLENANKGCFLLGILYRTDGQARKINFLEKLKERNLINSYAWTFKYSNDNEGLFILGGEPHTYDPYNYNQSNYFKTNPLEFLYGWRISLDQVYIGENLLETKVSGRISFSNNYILSDELYNKTIYKQYFKEYITKEICFYKDMYYSHSYYYCDKNKFKLQDMRKFPILKIINVELEMNFNFTGEELFYEGKDFYYFKLNFMRNSQGGWIIGQLFLRKYQFVFDYDGKTIGCYNNYRVPKDKGGNSDIDEHGDTLTPTSYKIYLYIFIPLTVVVIASIIFILIKLDLCGKKRKKLVNELEDEFNEDYFNINNSENKPTEENKESNEKGS